jgi:hypothetical protein
MSINSLNKQNNKLLCPYGRRCFADSSVCGFIGYYADCPQDLNEDSVFHGGFKAVKKNE